MFLSHKPRVAALVGALLLAAAPSAEAQWSASARHSSSALASYAGHSRRGSVAKGILRSGRICAPSAPVRSTLRKVWVPARKTWVRECGVLRLKVIPGTYRWVREPLRAPGRCVPLPSPGIRVRR